MTAAGFPEPVPVTEADFSPEFSDDALALEFSTRHAAELRYCSQWGTWLRWTGARWEFEKTLRTFDMARNVAREFARACNDPDDRTKIASASKVSAIERLARSDRRHATSVDLWDTDPWLLNTPGGMVDLRSGRSLPHDPQRYITKITAVAPGGACPRWRQFLGEITGGSEELQRFLQRIAGYALTGSVLEHALFFFYGTGGNGKGVFLNTLSKILADYAEVAPMETFVATHGERHPTDLAGLRGARLVTSQETEEGRRWAESKIKALTGGDPITARFMRQDFFTFTPTFKLVIAGNHKPGLRGVDEAIRRRFHLVPFTVTFKDRDTSLPDKLHAEWPGILAWAIEGCLAWQRDGLAPPPVVLEATQTYLGEEDAIARWIADCCILDANAFGESKRLWPSWQRWASEAGEFVGSQKRFGMALEAHGFKPGSTGSSRGYRGVQLAPPPEDSDADADNSYTAHGAAAGSYAERRG